MTEKERREKTVATRVTAKEFQEITQKAKDAKRKVSDYIRVSLLENK